MLTTSGDESFVLDFTGHVALENIHVGTCFYSDNFSNLHGIVITCFVMWMLQTLTLILI